MDSQQPNGTRALLLRDGLELLRAERLLVAEEAHEPGDVGAANGFVLARKPAELPEVREPARAIPTSEYREVVVVFA